MPIVPETPGEKLITLDGKIDRLDNKVDYVVDSLERVVTALERLETTRLSDHEVRIMTIEKWISEWKGVHRSLLILSILLGIGSLIVSFVAKH